jgi:hypothetical protein
MWTLEPADPRAAKELVPDELISHIDSLVDEKGVDDG